MDGPVGCLEGGLKLRRLICTLSKKSRYPEGEAKKSKTVWGFKVLPLPEGKLDK